MPTATRAALKRAATEAAVESCDSGYDSSASTHSQESCYSNSLSLEGKPLVIDLAKAEPEVSLVVTPEWPEEKKWEDTPVPSDQGPLPKPPCKMPSDSLQRVEEVL